MLQRVSEVTRKHEVSAIDNIQTCDCEVQKSNIFYGKSVFKIFSCAQMQA